MVLETVFLMLEDLSMIIIFFNAPIIRAAYSLKCRGRAGVYPNCLRAGGLKCLPANQRHT